MNQERIVQIGDNQHVFDLPDEHLIQVLIIEVDWNDKLPMWDRVPQVRQDTDFLFQ